MGYSSTRGSVPKSERYGKHRLNKSLSTRCIITIGILLPIVGAIIGVAAWAVGNEPVHLSGNGKGSNTLYNNIPLRYRNDLFEERNDHLLNEQQKVPIGSSVFLDDLGSKMVLETDEKEQNSRDILEDMGHQSSASPLPQKDSQKNDPLYVVHYVPQDAQPEVTSSQSVQESLSNSDVLSKILSASKVSGQKTPQFVVFAPMPADIPTQNFAENAEASPDYDDYEDRQERPAIKKNRSKKRRKHGKSLRIMDRDEEAESSEMDQVRPYGSRHQLPISDDVIQAGTHDSQHSSSVLKQTQDVFNQQNTRHRHRQQKGQYRQQHHQYKQQQQERQRLYEQQQQQQQQQLFPQREGSSRYPQKPCCDAEPSTYSNTPFQHASAGPVSDEHDADRYGQVSPPGISITLGGGHGIGKILPISPLGILRSLLRPLNPTFDLKKKLFFGVQLENGFGLGGKGKGGPDHGKHLGLTIDG